MTRSAALRLAGALTVAALLGGCAGGSSGWTKPGADEGAAAQAYQSCRSLAEERVGPEIGINQDILATRGTDWRRTQVGYVEARTMTEMTRDRAAAIVASCMNAQGFQPAP